MDTRLFRRQVVYFQNIVLNHIRKKVIFLNTDQVPAPEVKTGESIRNDVEALLVHQVSKRLLTSTQSKR